MAILESPDSQISDPMFDEFDESSDFGCEGSTTPISEFSPPESPVAKVASKSRHRTGLNARTMAASLSLEEQVQTQTIFTRQANCF